MPSSAKQFTKIHSKIKPTHENWDTHHVSVEHDTTGRMKFKVIQRPGYTINLMFSGKGKMDSLMKVPTVLESRAKERH